MQSIQFSTVPIDQIKIIKSEIVSIYLVLSRFKDNSLSHYCSMHVYEPYISMIRKISELCESLVMFGRLHHWLKDLLFDRRLWVTRRMPMVIGWHNMEIYAVSSKQRSRFYIKLPNGGQSASRPVYSSTPRRPFFISDQPGRICLSIFWSFVVYTAL